MGRLSQLWPSTLGSTRYGIGTVILVVVLIVERRHVEELLGMLSAGDVFACAAMLCVAEILQTAGSNVLY
jgi:hypothetical protein